MPTFNYKAITAAGHTVEDQLEASDQKEAMIKLRQLSLSPLEIKEQSNGPQQGSTFFKNGLTSNRVSTKNITQLTVQLSALVHANMNLAKALKALERQSVNEGVKGVINSLLDDVQKGKSLSDALERYPKHFSVLYVGSVQKKVSFLNRERYIFL